MPERTYADVKALIRGATRNRVNAQVRIDQWEKSLETNIDDGVIPERITLVATGWKQARDLLDLTVDIDNDVAEFRRDMATACDSEAFERAFSRLDIAFQNRDAADALIRALALTEGLYEAQQNGGRDGGNR